MFMRVFSVLGLAYV